MRTMLNVTVLLAIAGVSLAAAPPAQKCQGGKNEAAGKLAACLSKAEKKLALSGDPIAYSEATTKCTGKYQAKWQKLEQAAADVAATCPSSGDEASIQNFIDACGDAVADALAGSPLVTDPLTCGDNLETCNSDLNGCTTDYSNCSTDLATCNTNGTTCSDSLATCNAGTAVVGDVLSGKTFSSSAGLGVTGSMPNNAAVVLTPGTANQTIATGFHNGSGYCAGDGGLLAGNIRSGASIFGVGGSVIRASGDAVAAQVLSPAAFSNAGGAGTGTMPNVGQQNISPGAAAVAILPGYHNGTGVAAGDADLVEGNIVGGVSIFGVTGSAIAATGDAEASDVLASITFSSASGASTGTMPNVGQQDIIPGTVPVAITQGYHDGTGTVEGDPDLVAGNIASGVNIFGVTGSGGILSLPAQPLETGQTICFDAVGGVISCAGSGQDGELQRGVTRQYTDNGNGTISDDKTGLTWEKLSDDGSIHDQDNMYTWESAFSKITTLNTTSFAGYSDWRLPNAEELGTLVTRSAVNPAIDGMFHSNCAPGCTVMTCSCTVSENYWSSTTYEDLTLFAWSIYFYDGSVVADGKTSSFHVAAVRGGS